MNCPVCVGIGHQSVVTEGEATTTTAYYRPHLDSKQRVHHHDPNEMTWAYECSNGHKWWITRYGSCWCGWQKRRAPTIAVEPPAPSNQDTTRPVGKW